MNTTTEKASHTPQAEKASYAMTLETLQWELDSAKDGNTRYFIIHGQLPKGVNGDFGYPICDTMNRHHCISPDEDAANARLIAAAPELLKSLEALLVYLREFWPLEPLFSTYDDKQAMEIADAEAAIRKAKGEL